jgi:hypothetical protein
MSIALDYTQRVDPAALKAADVSDVCRYLSWLHRWGGKTHDHINPKIIQQAEYDELTRAGIGVTLNWEYDDHDWLGGASAGKDHAAEAVRQARALGYPAGRTIIGSADFDMTRSEWDSAGKAYALAWEAGIRAGGYRPGVYGPWDVLAWCDTETGIDVFWQAGMSTAWSHRRNAKAWPGAHLRQRCHKNVSGLDTDWNDILRPDWGQHGKSSMASIQEDDMAGGIPPRDIPVNGFDSPTVWPVNAGAAGHGPAWINLCNDTNGAKYAVRLYGTKGDTAYFPLGNHPDGIYVLSSGQRESITLPDGTAGLHVSRQPVDKTKPNDVYQGTLTYCVEYGFPRR